MLKDPTIRCAATHMRNLERATHNKKERDARLGVLKDVRTRKAVFANVFRVEQHDAIVTAKTYAFAFA